MHLGAEAVLERGDDPPAVGVVLGVGAGDEQQVQAAAAPVAADLDVPLLQHVQQRDLDALGEVGQLVDAEDAAVGAGDQAVVDGLGVAERAALGDLDRVDVADQVADAGVRCRQLLAEPVAAVQPADRGGVAVLGDLPARPDRDRVQRVLVELAADEDRRPLVEQADEVRIRRVLPWPRSPSRTRSWPAMRARSTSGTTVSSNPTMPGRLGSPGRGGPAGCADLLTGGRRRRCRGARRGRGGGGGEVRAAGSPGLSVTSPGTTGWRLSSLGRRRDRNPCPWR